MQSLITYILRVSKRKQEDNRENGLAPGTVPKLTCHFAVFCIQRKPGEPALLRDRMVRNRYRYIQLHTYGKMIAGRDRLQAS